ncbi:hypothetical protein ACIRCZ_19590 [Leifsonia sp. NPDC102414]|uniref:hypothetical protein n=1 Tax=Leifsonia sp. NPDC102414 TaxID=3364124 RepID=UPI0037FB0594
MVYELPEELPGGGPRTPRKAGAGPTDLGSAIGFLILQSMLSVGLSVAGLFLLFGIDSCGAARCNYPMLEVALYLIPATAVASFIASVLGVIFRQRRRLSTWWIPAIGCVPAILAFVIATQLIDRGINP